MNKHKVPYRSRKNKYILLLCSLILFFSIFPPVNAHLLVNHQSLISQNNSNKPRTRPDPRKITERYKKPLNASKPIKSPTGIGGVRRGSCPQQKESGISLVNLAPKDHVGQTVSTHPTFSWYVSGATSYPIEFVLYRLSDDKKGQTVVYKESMYSQQGIMQTSLPKNEPGLSLDEHYFWYVIADCYPNRPARNPGDESQFEVVKASPDFNLQIQNENNELKKAELYAQEGFWYDAFAHALQASQNIYTQKLQRELLLDLAKAENKKQQSILFELVDNQFK